MTDNSIIADILKEVKRQKREDVFPDHILASTAIISISAGQLAKECCFWKYNRPEMTDAQQEILDNMRRHAIHICANSLRFLESLKDVKIESKNGVE